MEDHVELRAPEAEGMGSGMGLKVEDEKCVGCPVHDRRSCQVMGSAGCGTQGNMLAKGTGSDLTAHFHSSAFYPGG